MSAIQDHPIAAAGLQSTPGGHGILAYTADFSVDTPAKPIQAESRINSSFGVHVCGKSLSPWSRSLTKRLFDIACVVLALPVLLPVGLLIALAVRISSRGPVLFLQERMGRHGSTFTILKFRTMIHDTDRAHHAVTTANNQRFTPVGPFLRRYKLDELPQLLNVLVGHMSLVGPRPKMPEHATVHFPCRPGVTGAATCAFAREEQLLERVPRHTLNDYYHKVVLPAKSELDADYMAKATFRSDLQLIVNSVLRRWDDREAEIFLHSWERQTAEQTRHSKVTSTALHVSHVPMPPAVDHPMAAERAAGF